jgi:hypothetical protein
VRAVLAFLVLLPACSSRSTGLREASKSAAEPRPAPPGHEEVDRARRLWQEGKEADALAAVREALARNPDRDVREQLLPLKLEYRRLLFQKDGLACETEIPPGPYEDRDTVRCLFRVRNVGARPVRIPGEATRRVALVFKQSVGESLAWTACRVGCRDLAGTAFEQEWSMAWPAWEDLDLAPGEARDFPIALPTAELPPTPGGYRRLRVGAQVRPVRILWGEEELFLPLLFPERLVLVLPQGGRRLADDPSGSLQKAIARAARDRRFLPHIVLAAILGPPEQQERAREQLRTAAAGDDRLVARAAATALLELDEVGAAAPAPGK